MLEDKRMKRKRILCAALVLAWFFVPASGWAHHGGVSLALGPGSPLETNSPLTLPEGGVVISTRFEHVEWREWSRFKTENKESFSLLNLGFSYGITPWLMGTLFIQYTVKRHR